jgi:hypothetical protein
MSRSGRIATVIVIGAAAVLEVVAYLLYRDTVDGQAVLANAAIAVYAFLAVGVIALIDRAARAVMRRRRARQAR